MLDLKALIISGTDSARYNRIDGARSRPARGHTLALPAKARRFPEPCRARVINGESLDESVALDNERAGFARPSFSRIA